jgi:hypothetical protein
LKRLLCRASGWLAFVIIPAIAILVQVPEGRRFWAGLLVTTALSLAAKLLFPWWFRLWRVE